VYSELKTDRNTNRRGALNIFLTSQLVNCLQLALIARLPQRGVHRGRTLSVDHRGKIRSRANVVWVDVLRLSPTVMVREHLYWRDLETALRCVTANADNFDFWRQIRVINVDFVENHVTGTRFPTGVGGTHHTRRLTGPFYSYQESSAHCTHNQLVTNLWQ
jgi:hypothetical protein